ncbi:MAG: glycosyltransferase family 9 protein [Endomicrobia bacterium]|nr:glycosyltransferase family 9 protein [Endomicrobiia bacterium]
MKLLTMQKIDKLIGPIICTFLTIFDKVFTIFNSKKDKIDKKYPNKIMLLKFWGMGSIIIAIPAIENIKRFYPLSKIYFLSLKRNEELLNSYKEIIDYNFLVEIDKGIFKFFVEIAKALLRIRREKIDIFIDLEFFTRFSSIISYLSRAKVKAGFNAWEVWRGDLHNIKVPFNRYWHVKKNFENLISKAIGKECVDELKLVPPYYKDEDIVLRRFSLRDYICINPNSGELALQRRWPKNNFVELSKRILNHFDNIEIVCIGSKYEREYVESIIKSTNSKAIKNLAGEISFQELITLLKKSKLFITNDSGPLHLAATLGVRTISFFGPETPILYGPQGENHIVFFKNIDCSPCINVHTGKVVKCYKVYPNCMLAISVDDVFNVVKEILNAQLGNEK